MTTNFPGLSILIPSIPETSEYLLLALRSIYNFKHNDTKVFVWFNGYSQDDAKKILEQTKPYIETGTMKTIYSSQNVGQSIAMNRFAAEFCETKYMMVMNDDMVVGPGFDVGLVSFLEDSAAGDFNSVEGRVFDFASPKLIEPGTKVPVAPQFISKDFGDDVTNFKYGEFIEYCKANTPANKYDVKFIEGEHSLPFIIRTRTYNAVGGWDERMTLGPCADIDFYRKLEIMQIPTVQISAPFVYHFSGKATRLNPAFNFAEVEQRNNALFHIKWSK